jgi:hypothetical protein
MEITVKHRETKGATHEKNAFNENHDDNDRRVDGLRDGVGAGFRI